MKKVKLLSKKPFRNFREIYEVEKMLKNIVMKQFKITIRNRNKQLCRRTKISKRRTDFVFQIFSCKAFGIVTCVSCKKVKNSLPYHKRLCKQCYSSPNEEWSTW